MRVYEMDLLKDNPVNANIESDPIQVWHYVMSGIQVIWTDTINGTLKLEMSNDAVHWDYDDASIVNITAAGTKVYNVWAVGTKWVRINFIDASDGTSTGTMSATVFCKG
jgi:hypothetical protein